MNDVFRKEIIELLKTLEGFKKKLHNLLKRISERA